MAALEQRHADGSAESHSNPPGLFPFLSLIDP